MSSQFNFALLMLSISTSLPLPSSSLPHVPPADNLDYLQNVVVLCQEIQCPVLTCSHPIRIEGQCCPICLQPEIPGMHCTHAGRRIEDGQKFSPNAGDSCIGCTCNNGTITCEDVSAECPPLLCSEDSAIIPENGCCPVCPEVSVAQCMDIDGRTFSDGEWWHPAFTNGEILHCINCTCVDSRSECVPLSCPKGPLPPCDPDAPIPEVILCCPTCSRNNIPTKTAPTPSTTTPTPSMTTPTPSVTTPTPSAAPTPVLITCNPAYTVKVWLHKAEDRVAVEFTKQKNSTVKTYSWTSVGGDYVREERLISAGSFNRMEYNLSGWTIVRRVNGLTSRVNKRRKIESCRSDCARFVNRLLKPLENTMNCDEGLASTS